MTQLIDNSLLRGIGDSPGTQEKSLVDYYEEVATVITRHF